MPLSRILVGDAAVRLRELPDRSAQTCICSPPYFGLRDYGVPGQIGHEQTVAEYVAALLAVFEQVRRVLRDDGTLWVVLGDSYAGSWGAQSRRTVTGGVSAHQIANHPKRGSRTGTIRASGVKPKDLYGVPWTVAFAMRDAGWYLRRDVIWSKPAPMPESARDRPTTSHEYVFLFAKQPTYFYDADAIREASVSLDPSHSSFRPSAVALANGTGRHESSGKHAHSARVVRHTGRNKRSVWTVATRPFKGAHFATFPPELIEPMILASTAPVACAKCGAPYRRTFGPAELDATRPQARRALDLAHAHRLTPEHIDAIRAAGITDAGKTAATQSGTGRNADEVRRLAAEAKAALGGYYREFLLARPAPSGWVPSCACPQKEAGRCVVLDPFGGAGTTGLVAQRHGRASILVELNPAYADMARRRIHDDAPLFTATDDDELLQQLRPQQLELDSVR